jgi:hypothetical protein
MEPTSDGRAIRNAFVRLAQIYHPDRFAGLGPDVQAEAERRMKEVSVAYETLRTKAKSDAKAPPPQRSRAARDAWEQAKRFREEVEARRLADTVDRQRWQRWDQLEQEARERAEWEASMAANLADDFDGIHHASEPEDEPAPRPQKSLLLQRLEEAGMGSDGHLPMRRRVTR